MKNRAKWVTALAVVIGGIWLMGVFYVLSYKPDVYINPGVVVSAPSPVAVPVQSVRTSRRLSSHNASPATPSFHPIYSPKPVSSAPSHGLYLTSGANVHSVGGGGSFALATTSHSSSGRGISYSTVNVSMPAATFVALASQRQVSQPAASEAPQMARLAASPRTAPGPPNPTGPLEEEHQLVEHPVPLGDALWVLLVMVILYGALMRRAGGRLYPSRRRPLLPFRREDAPGVRSTGDVKK